MLRLTRTLDAARAGQAGHRGIHSARGGTVLLVAPALLAVPFVRRRRRA